MIAAKPVLVVGASSTVGRGICSHLKEIMRETPLFTTSFQSDGGGSKNWVRLDITDSDAVRRVVQEIGPAWLINFAANADVFSCEADLHGAEAVNRFGAKNVAEACGEQGTRMIQISTDYVFDGTQGPYDESAKPNPINAYGKTKWLGEKECEQHLSCSCAIVRLSHVYDTEKDVNTGMLIMSEDMSSIEVPSDIFTTPTHIRSISPLLLQIMADEESGVHHISDGIQMSWYDLSCELASHKGIPLDRIIPVKADEWRRDGTRVRWPKNGGIVSRHRKHK